MEQWVAMVTDRLWDFAIAAIPLVILVAAVGRWLPCRPATRHALWVAVVAFLVAAPFVPQAPSFAPLVKLLASAEPIAATDHHQAIAAVADPPTVRRPVARQRPKGKPDAPNRLAQATGFGGPLTTHDDHIPAFERTDAPTAARVTSRPSVSALEPVGSRERTARTTPARQGIHGNAVTRRGTSTPRSASGTVASRAAVTAPMPQYPTESASAPVDRAPRLRSVRPADVAERTIRVVSMPVDGGEPELESATPFSIDTLMGHAASAWVAWVAGVMAVRDAVTGLPAFPGFLWISGGVVFALWVMVRMFCARRLVRSAVPAPRSVIRMVGAAAASMGLRRVPVTLMVNRRVSPMVLCGRRTRLILPRKLWSQLDDPGRRAVIYHELAHVRRRDHWVFWADALVGLVYWWYPLVWWVRSRLHAEAELSCDAWVTSLMPEQRRAYAEALLHTKRYLSIDNRSMPVGGIGITTGRAARFGRRITMVMTGSTKPGLSASGVALAMTVAFTGWLVAPARSCPNEKSSAKAPCVTTTPTAAVAVSPAAKITFAPVVTTATSAFPALKIAPVVALGASCAQCADQKPCKDCTKARAGKCCGDCPDGGCKDCAKSIFSGVHDGRSFMKKMSTHAGKTGEGPHGMFAGGKHGPHDSMRVAFGGGDGDMEKRMRALEKRLEKLGDQLTRISGAVARGHDEGSHDRPHADHARAHRSRGHGHSRSRRRGYARALRAPRARRAPRAPRAPHPPRAPMPPRADEPGNDGEIIATYKLPDGKRQALTELMVRSDVPILVSPRDDGIEVHGTRRQQRIFRAFVNMINGADDDRSEATPEPTFEEKAREYYARALEEERQGKAHADLLQSQYYTTLQSQWPQVRKWMERERIQGKLQYEALGSPIPQLRRQLLQLDQQRGLMRRQLERVRESSERARRSSARVRARAEQLRTKANELGQGGAEENNETHRMGIERRYAEMLATAENFARESEAFEAEAEFNEVEAEALETQSDNLDDQVDELAERIEELHDRAEADADAAADRDDNDKDHD